jgi:hypothetical protein
MVPTIEKNRHLKDSYLYINNCQLYVLFHHIASLPLTVKMYIILKVLLMSFILKVKYCCNLYIQLIVNNAHNSIKGSLMIVVFSSSVVL